MLGSCYCAVLFDIDMRTVLRRRFTSLALFHFRGAGMISSSGLAGCCVGNSIVRRFLELLIVEPEGYWDDAKVQLCSDLSPPGSTRLSFQCSTSCELLVNAFKDLSIPSYLHDTSI
jgi:hypothetical protein